MKNRFNLNESEKNRIRGLHGINILSEQNEPAPDGNPRPIPNEFQHDLSREMGDYPIDTALNDGKITRKEYKGLQKYIKRLAHTMEKNLRRKFKGKTINLYSDEASVGPGPIQHREGEEEYGTVKIRKITYNPNLYMPTINPGHIWDSINMTVSPVDPEGFKGWMEDFDRFIKGERNLTLRVSCFFAGGQMWLDRFTKEERKGGQAIPEDSNVVTNSEFMKDIQDTFCKSPEMKQMERVMTGLKKAKVVDDADYAQVDDQDDSEELV